MKKRVRAITMQVAATSFVTLVELKQPVSDQNLFSALILKVALMTTIRSGHSDATRDCDFAIQLPTCRPCLVTRLQITAADGKSDLVGWQGEGFQGSVYVTIALASFAFGLFKRQMKRYKYKKKYVVAKSRMITLPSVAPPALSFVRFCCGCDIAKSPSGSIIVKTQSTGQLRILVEQRAQDQQLIKLQVFDLKSSQLIGC